MVVTKEVKKRTRHSQARGCNKHKRKQIQVFGGVRAWSEEGKGTWGGELVVSQGRLQGSSAIQKGLEGCTVLQQAEERGAAKPGLTPEKMEEEEFRLGIHKESFIIKVAM